MRHHAYTICTHVATGVESNDTSDERTASTATYRIREDMGRHENIAPGQSWMSSSSPNPPCYVN
jgi:hypothetical protein